MDQLEPFLSLGVALAMGMLIGFEREQHAFRTDEFPEGGLLGGARTFPLVALTGALATFLAREVSLWAFIAIFVGLGTLVVAGYVEDLVRKRDRGLTSEVAFLITFVLGALAPSPVISADPRHRSVVLLSVAVVVTLILSLKPKLHAFARTATRDDLYATLKFLVVAVVILPLLPDRPVDPWGVVVPSKVGLLVVLIAGIDFVGYVLVRVLGAGRGLGIAGLVGGLASSTAVTLSFSARARARPDLTWPYLLAVVSASSVMFPRVLAVVALTNSALVAQLVLPLGAMAVAGAIVSFVVYRRARALKATTEEVPLENPFELSAALKFGALFTVVLVAAKLATQYFGSGGSYLAGVLAGATDVDSITLSMANLAHAGAVAPAVAVTTIILGCWSNTVVKGVMATTLGGWEFGRRVALAFAGLLLAGALGLAAVWLRA